MFKQCKVCGEVKPLSDFYAMRGMRDGYRNECKSCNNAAKKLRYLADPRAAIRRTERWRAENAERYRAYQREYRQKPERKRAMRDLYYRRTFGITADEFDALLERQGGGCAICGKRPALTQASGWDCAGGGGKGKPDGGAFAEPAGAFPGDRTRTVSGTRERSR